MKSRMKGLVAAARWRWLQVDVRLRSYARLQRRRVVGFLSSSPNPASATRTDGRASIKLAWNVIGSGAVEVRLGKPGGRLVSSGGASGETTTGTWVTDGTVFYLQDVDGGLPLTRAHTLAVTRVTVRTPSKVQPKVSVLLITYNHESYVQAALESVLSQETTFPFEVVVGDDASLDGTQRILREFAGRDDRLRLSLMDRNTAGTTNFLRALDMCEGEYIATLEGDDYWTDPQKLQLQVDFLEARPGYSLCFHNCRVEHDDGGPAWNMMASFGRQEVTTDEILRQETIAHTSTIVMRREVVDHVRKLSYLFSDWFVVLMASQLGGVGYVDRVMSVYRQHSNGVFSSLSAAEKWAECTRFYNAVESVLDDRYRDSIAALRRERSYLAAMEYEKSGDFGNAEKFLYEALSGDVRWLEPYSSRHGVAPEVLARKLRRKALLYRYPWLLRLSRVADRVTGELRWYRLRAGVRLRRLWPLKRIKAAGALYAFPNPAHSSGANPELSTTTLHWTASGTEAVEIRAGTPQGPLISRSAPLGSVRTGEWVSDGMIFFLQRADGEPRRTPADTLDVVRVRVRP